MNLTVRLLSALFTAIPAAVFGACSFLLFQGEYFWTTYLLVAGIYVAASAICGILLPARLQSAGMKQPWIWLFFQGMTAWGLALLALWVFNLTPLCVGQDNGDGVNGFGQCLIQSAAISAAFTPGVLLLLWLSATLGDRAIGKFIPRQEPDW